MGFHGLFLVEKEYNDIASIPLDETDTEISYGPGPYLSDYNQQSFPNGPAFQTGFQSQPSVTSQPGDLRAYTLNIWEVADMQALTSLNDGKGVGYDFGAVVMNATAPAAQIHHGLKCQERLMPRGQVAAIGSWLQDSNQC